MAKKEAVNKKATPQKATPRKKKLIIGGVIVSTLVVSAFIAKKITEKNKKHGKNVKPENVDFLAELSCDIIDFLNFGIPKEEIQKVKEEIAKEIALRPSITEVCFVISEKEQLFI